MDKCIVCSSKNLTNVIRLGLHPPADSFLKTQDIESQKLHQLGCQLCNDCGHLQNQVLVSNNERYEDIDYSYTSSNSKISMSHWDEYFETVSVKTELVENDHIVEFGSNDGYLTNLFNVKFDATGIEPSPYLAKISSQNGLDVINGYLCKDTINQATKKKGLCKWRALHK